MTATQETMAAPNDMSEKKRGSANAETTFARKTQRKKQKASAALEGEWERCIITGAQYCGNHLPADATVSSKKAQKFKAHTRTRVPCPVDKTHTVYVYDLDKHVLVCNKVKDANAMKLLPFYTENINSGTHAIKEQNPEKTVGKAPTQAANDETTIVDGASEQEDQQQEHTGLSKQEEQGLIDKLEAIDFPDLVRRIHASYERCVGEIPLQKLNHTCCNALYAEKKEAGSSKNILRHIEQQASILGHMERMRLLDDEKATFVELGAGRGMLSYALAQQFRGSVYVLIDRAHMRGKADRFIESLEASAPSGSDKQVVRAKIDIRHLNFAGMKEVQEKPVVCMSKHLCGVATDLSLRAITQTLSRSSNGNEQSQAVETESASKPSVSPLFQGLAVALCCHHVCTWEDYVNPAFILEQGFKEAEFALLTSMSSWATCGMGLEGDVVEYTLGISKPDRAILGRRCKRILDAGRAAYLENFQLHTQLVHYCEEGDSIENCLLLAWK
uniref:tRNA:m(4)X modification enzyme TRM13 n=1 Tax=Globisporangium ultimum (strain ATCC 200006 / CBS 805.95 / DAOM BR144) TaxID=431595 RepID=K3WRJ6_GLOUD